MAGNNTRSPYKVKVSHRFISASLLLSVLVAFAVGRTARIYLLLQNADKAIQQSAGANLPNPVLQKGKIPPQSIYSSKHFDTALASSSNSRWIIIEDEPQECSSDANTTEMDFDDDEVHLPKGQHLLLDIRHVDSEFLGSEERLAHTMMNVVNSCGLTLLSYHCHGLKPAGVSCVGILLESHVSFHTFPSQGVIIFDLFTCGDSSLLPIVPAAVKAFSVPRTATPAAAMKSHTKTSKSKTILPEPVWAYKFRGYGADNEDTIDQLTDFFTFPIGAMTDYKKEIISINTGKHRIDIYDVLRPHFQLLNLYRRSIENRKSYEYRHKEVFEPDRILFIDGGLELRRSGERSFHEALIHPAMFAHPNPKRVAVIGGGSGAHVREILKHKTVEKVVVIQGDEEIVNINKDYFPEFSDCASFNIDNENCWDDSRVEMVYSMFKDWLEEKFKEGNNASESSLFDVIIIDDMGFLEESYNDEHFVKFISNFLSPEGIFVAYVGEISEVNSPSEEYSYFKYRHRLMENLSKCFESVRDFEESHSGDEWPLKFVVGFRNKETRENWFRNEASVNLEIRKRSISSNADSLFLHFDGATMQSYMYPSKFSETAYCRQSKIPETCLSKFAKMESPLVRLEGTASITEVSLLAGFSISRHGKESQLATYDPAADRQPSALFVTP